MIKILFFLFIPLYSFAQDTLTKQIDQFTKEVSYVTTPQSYVDSSNNKGVVWKFKKTARGTVFYIGGVANESLGCIDNEAPIMVLFLDGSKDMIRNYRGFTCTDDFFATVLSKKKLKNLSEKKIKALRFYYYKKLFDIDIPLETASIISKEAVLISNAEF